MRLLTLLLLFTLSISLSYSQDFKEASRKQKAAETAFNSKNYSKASRLIDDAIGILESKGERPPQSWNDLKQDIDNALRRQKERAEREKNKKRYEELLSRAKRDIDNERYSDAKNNLESALDVYNGSEAKRLLNSIEDIQNKNKVNRYISDASNELSKGNKEEALVLYQKARELDYKSVSTNSINELKSDISNYKNFTEKAEELYLSGEYNEVLDLIDRAEDYMSLKDEHSSLKDNANYNVFKAKGDIHLSSNEYDLAVKAFQKAKLYAKNRSSESEINYKIKEAIHNMYVSKANENLESGNLEDALSAIESAEKEKELSSEGTIVKKKIYDKIEDQIWKGGDYKRYLHYYPNGKYTNEARQALVNLNFEIGESQRKSHNYSSAITAYKEASKYAYESIMLEEGAKINKKIKQTERWKSAGGSFYSELSADIPFGFAATSLTTYDQYGFMYNLSGQMGEYTEYDTGMGYTKHSDITALAPFGFDVRFYAPVRINNIAPIRFYAALTFNSFKTLNLNNVEAIKDYNIYNEGDTYEPTNEYINSMDTIYNGLYMNALRFTQIGAKLGVRPIDYLTVYIPIQKVSLRVQPGAPCLDCTTQEVEMGELGAGLGLEVNYTAGSMAFSAFWENWNGNFNKRTSTNVLFDGGSAGSSLFSPNAYSRSLGMQVGYIMDFSDLMISLRYENLKIRGKFRGSGGAIQEVHEFSQHLLRLRLTYILP